MSKRLIGCVAVVLAVAVFGGLYLAGQYNRLVEQEQATVAQWSQVENVYQRRADLIPNLVATVKGAANFEQQTLQGVIDARSRVGQVSSAAASELINNPQKFAQFQSAQDGLSSALSRLLVVVERYPELKAVAAYQDLMVQLEGTETRIPVERRRFNEVAQGFNTRLKRFPTRQIASLFGWSFQEKAYFTAQPGAETAPKVEF